jgi:hypothetical protein
MWSASPIGNGTVLVGLCVRLIGRVSKDYVRVWACGELPLIMGQRQRQERWKIPRV